MKSICQHVKSLKKMEEEYERFNAYE